MQVCWLSIDPLRKKIDFYPYNIAVRIEKAYREQKETSRLYCILGSDFFDSTIHFKTNGSCYQTTLGISFKNNFHKKPGYRSVKRIIKYPDSDNNITIHCHNAYGELRIIENNSDININIRVDKILTGTIPSNCLINCDTLYKINLNNYRHWTNEDLLSGNLDDYIIVWQWCNGMPEYQGNLNALSEKWWRPYMYMENAIIEEAFSNNLQSVNINIPNCGMFTVKFIQDHMYASQYSCKSYKNKFVRRVIKTVGELKNILDNLEPLPINIYKLINTIPEETIPPEFICSITQDIMRNPVKTVDGHTYDKPGILRWFETKNTSPLTGLPIPSKSLIPNKDLHTKIEKFINDILVDKK